MGGSTTNQLFFWTRRGFLSGALCLNNFWLSINLICGWMRCYSGCIWWIPSTFLPRQNVTLLLKEGKILVFQAFVFFFFNLPGMWVCVSRSQEDLPSGFSNVTMVPPLNVSLFIAKVHYPGLWWVYAFSAELRGWSLLDERRNFGLSISHGACLFVFLSLLVYAVLPIVHIPHQFTSWPHGYKTNS